MSGIAQIKVKMVITQGSEAPGLKQKSRVIEMLFKLGITNVKCSVGAEDSAVIEFETNATNPLVAPQSTMLTRLLQCYDLNTILQLSDRFFNFVDEQLTLLDIERKEG